MIRQKTFTLAFVFAPLNGRSSLGPQPCLGPARTPQWPQMRHGGKRDSEGTEAYHKLVKLPAQLALIILFLKIQHFSSSTFPANNASKLKTILMERSSNRLWSRSLDLCNCPLHTSGLLHSHGGSRSHPEHFSLTNISLRSYSDAIIFTSFLPQGRPGVQQPSSPWH